MNCLPLYELWKAIENEEDEARRRLVEVHVDGCVKCQRALEQGNTEQRVMLARALSQLPKQQANHCPQVSEVLEVACGGGQLGAEHITEIRKHLNHCEHCLSLFAESRLWAGDDGTAFPAAPPRMAQQWLRTTNRAKPWNWARLGVTTGSIITAGLALMFILDYQKTGMRPSIRRDAEQGSTEVLGSQEKTSEPTSTPSVPGSVSQDLARGNSIGRPRSLGAGMTSVALVFPSGTGRHFVESPTDKQVVYAGDRFQVSLRQAAAFRAFVFLVGSDGAVVTLFGADHEGISPANSEITLPALGEWFEAKAAKGTAELYVIAAPDGSYLGRNLAGLVDNDRKEFLKQALDGARTTYKQNTTVFQMDVR